ncbi:inorganic phosphate transporter [Vagococcus intermedius]|uniref:Inorganic phosphate transporter n=1 Tax=Vagococcus intermedius TaxID=2991418 RepID=A0AAF0I6C9_9ENTE|nr:inorganic phosphate transporter [Vagococcus intermedius]WEG72689.1 inorganic phosphate transporter [Vagococcus intermedius]WEG74774.1 inorganic phosphate transporter [Vagococcus intermedius]
MDQLFILTVVIVACSLVFDLINGFHDTANAIATSVSTKALKPKHAIMLAACMNFLGALLFQGVAKRITDDIVLSSTFDLPHVNMQVVLISALLSAIAWNLITWYFGIPSSSSHALIGSIAGATVAAAGFSAINKTGLLEIFGGLILSPVLAFFVGYIVYTIIKFIFKNHNLSRANRNFRLFQILTAALQSFTHGTNDAQKAMGIITMALIAGGYQSGSDVQTWVQIACATAMAIGTSIGGWKIIKTVGGKIMKIKPVTGVAADISSVMVIFSATLLHLPVSTTHVISSAIMGVGTSHRPKGVKWDTGKRMLFTWVITLPVSAIISTIIFSILNLIIK